MTETARWSDEELAALEDGLTAENLSAIMRSTWTWDDRALRRDLARVLTELTAVRELTPSSTSISWCGVARSRPRRRSWQRSSARGSSLTPATPRASRSPRP